MRILRFLYGFHPSGEVCDLEVHCNVRDECLLDPWHLGGGDDFDDVIA